MHAKRKKTDLYQSQINATPLPGTSITEHKGVLYLHLGTDWIQGAMRITKPNTIILEYVQQMMMWMLFNSKPEHIVQLGLGSGALTKFCYHHFLHAKVTAVELNPAVIKVCQSTFCLPPNDERLNVLEANALDFVKKHATQSDIDILQIDLYDQDARAPVLDTPEFYQACADSLKPDGMMTVNLFGGDHFSYTQSIEAIEPAFDAVIWLPEVHEANTIALAFKKSPSIDFTTLYERASEIRRNTSLQSKSWVDGMMLWMREMQSA